MSVVWVISLIIGIYQLLFAKSNKVHVISRKEEERERKREEIRSHATKERLTEKGKLKTLAPIIEK